MSYKTGFVNICLFLFNRFSSAGTSTRPGFPKACTPTVF